MIDVLTRAPDAHGRMEEPACDAITRLLLAGSGICDLLWQVDHHAADAPPNTHQIFKSELMFSVEA